MKLAGRDRRRQKGPRMLELPMDALRPGTHQPRKDFSEEELMSLAASIRENGILQPLLVRESNGGYELIAGERRLRAAKIAGLRTVPCVISDVGEEGAAFCALIENLQRQDLSFFEEAEGIASLIREFGISQSQAAQRLGKRQSTVANKLRLLRFSQTERELIGRYQLTERHARALLRIENEPVRMRLLQIAGEKGLNVAQTEALVEDELEGGGIQSERRKPIVIVKDVRIFLNTVTHALKLMQQSGIPASEEQNETEDCIEYIIRIPKQAVQKKQSA